MILVQIEVIFFAVPVIILLDDLSTDAKYIGYVTLFSVFSLSALGLIFIPKMFSLRRFNRGITGPTPIRGAANGSVHVSGVNTAGRHSNVSNVSRHNNSIGHPASEYSASETNGAGSERNGASG